MSTLSHTPPGSTPGNTPGSAQGSQSVNQMAQAIQRIVASNGRRWRRLTVLEGVGLAIAAPLGFLWLAFLLDNVLHLAMWGRVLVLLAFLAVAGYLAWRLVSRWKQLRLTEDQVALAIEKRTPRGVQNRLINAIQIAREGKVENRLAFEQALIQENYQQLQAMQLQQAAQARPAIVRLVLAAIVITAGVCFWFFMPQYFSNAAQRILMPLGHIEPIYRTRLALTPGQLNDRGEFPFTVTIEGKQPSQLLVIQNRQGRRSTTRIPVDADQKVIHYTLADVTTSMTFAVVGNDYTTAYHQIVVPRPAILSQVQAVYSYPSYTKQPDKQVTSADGRLEALSGTLANLTFILDQPAAEARLYIHRDADSATAPRAVNLTRGSGPGVFTGQIMFKDVIGYELLTRREQDETFHQSRMYPLVETLDQEPALELRGLSDQAEIDFDMPAALQIIANDDYGLAKVSLVHRNLANDASAAAATSTQNQLLAFLENNQADTQAPAPQPWQDIRQWPGDDKTTFTASHSLQVESLGAAEGDQIDILLRAQDNDPARIGQWSQGKIYRITIGGQGVTLQLLYENMLRDETRIRQLLQASQKLRSQSIQWLQKLDPSANFDLQQAANQTQWSKGMARLIQGQHTMRSAASELARSMNAQAGNLRLSISMLADTEMIRSVRIIERAAKAQADDLRTTLSNARLTQDRIIKSLEDVLAGHVKYRQEWEDANMGPFIHMMATRQAALRDHSEKLASQGTASADAGGPKQTAQRRQQKLVALAQLASLATGDVGNRFEESQPILAKAFTQASTKLAEASLKQTMTQAATLAAAGNWPGAIQQQAEAAKALAAIDKLIDDARKEAARQLVAQIKATAMQESKAASQGEVDELRKNAGALFIDAPENMSIKQIIQMREKVQQEKGEVKTVGGISDFLVTEKHMAMLNAPNKERVDSDTLQLATKATESNLRSPNQSDRQGNEVPPNISEDFEDVVGDLLEGLETLQEDYDTLNLNANFSITDPGEIGQQAGDINSNSASAATGNKQPPPNQIGGMSRSGRKGARSHGTAIGDESFNRRGRNEAQEGMERVKDVNGLMREVQTDDPQIDMSTGVGGKVIDTKESHFSTKDKGKWTDDIADRMRKPLEKNQIVERQDGTRMDPKVAQMLYELEGTQEQIVERLKVIRKKLDNLYLPTDQLDELMAQLNANLDALRQRPDAELFRKQLQTIDQLRSSIRVFGQAHSGFEPSMPREQIIKGNVLDTPARQALPGYEEAVRNYYMMLSTQ